MGRLFANRPARQGALGMSLATFYEPIAAWFDDFSEVEEAQLERTGAYHALVRDLYRAQVPAGSRVLEIGSGRGDLLAALRPERGVGVDVSERMVAAARARHPALEFHHGPGEELDLGEEFDVVVLSDLVPYVYDLQQLLAAVKRHCHRGTRVIANSYSLAWRPLLLALAHAGIRARRPIRNWVAPADLENLFALSGLEVVSRRAEILMPVGENRASGILNRLLARLPLLRALCFSYWLVGRPGAEPQHDLGVSVIVPCRNEAGNVAAVAERVPEMGRGTEIVFVEGGSSDNTRGRIRDEVDRGTRDMKVVLQSGKGKGNAVWEGFEAAEREILMILDADLTVAPEDLPKFYDALVSGRGELINGSRLVYELEPGAMRFLNILGNKAFASLMSMILGQYVKDTLCGTKVMFRDDWERLRRQANEVGLEDPWGDYDLLLGSSLLGLRILNVPVRYHARTYGETNMRRFTHGRVLWRVAMVGLRRSWIRPGGP
ncbi:MAG: glycosyltransferase [Thermoleophilaceae bacterium]|nr:glycosyltransferase [Thermoleophilaceae bacterium]